MNRHPTLKDLIDDITEGNLLAIGVAASALLLVACALTFAYLSIPVVEAIDTAQP